MIKLFGINVRISRSGSFPGLFLLLPMKKTSTLSKSSKSLSILFLLIFPFLHSSAEADGGPKTLLWKISGNGLSTPSYLYGTIHMGDKKILNFKKPVMPAFESCEVYAMELDPGNIDPMAILDNMKLKEGTLQDLFTEEEWTTLDTYFREKFKTPLSTFNEFSPFYVQTMIMQAQMGSKAGQAVDLHFYDQARKRRMEVVGIETLEEQLATVNNLPAEDQKQMVLDAVDEDYKASMEQMVKLYRKGDLEGLQAMSDDEEENSEEFEETLVIDRNKIMAERIIPLIKEAPTFVGVGALHLPGEEGLIQLLRDAGYSVDPVK